MQIYSCAQKMALIILAHSLIEKTCHVLCR